VRYISKNTVVYGKLSRKAGNFGGFTNKELETFERLREPLESQCVSPERACFYYVYVYYIPEMP
jgi:hypothetical protein